MRLFSMPNRPETLAKLVGLVTGGVLLQATAGCGEQVRAAALDGIENVIIVIVQAFFAGINPSSSGSATAQLITDAAGMMFA